MRPERTANHTRGYNPRSIGIEIVNVGRYPDWLDSTHQDMPEAYTEAQIEQLIGLAQQLQSELPNLQFIAGHEDLDTAQVPASDNPECAGVPQARSGAEISLAARTVRNPTHPS